MPVVYEKNKVRSWASIIDAGTMLQAEMTARLPFVSDPLALMPDAHVGRGATIGSVIATDGAIIPAAVGVDIGCGMVATLTSLTAGDLPEDLWPLRLLIESRIPAGLGQGHDRYTEGVMQQIGHPRSDLTGKQQETMWCQFGTLGSGNHFGEICLDENDRVWTVLHSGSRGIGKQLAEAHINLAKAQHQALEDPDLAYFLEGTDAFAAYIADMLWAQAYAFGSRQKMANAMTGSLFEACGQGKVTDVINCHHNFSQQEEFGGKWLWITRKGAIKADEGDRGVIPGSMGARSYIVRGNGVNASWRSCAHGAGRVMSRARAKRELTVESLNEAMTGKTWNSDRPEHLVDEHPDAYKPIGTVMADQADLVTVEHELHQVLNFKG
jgi:RNA-splicing ligase RtcB